MFCFLCQTGSVPKNVREKGFVWVHLECIMKLFDIKSDFGTVKEILEGKRSEPVEIFLARMQDFDKKWENTKQLLKEHGVLEE